MSEHGIISVMLRRCLLLWLACGCLPPDKPDHPATPSDPDLVLVAHPWLVENHILTGNPMIGEGDAILMHGRKVEITATTYKTPFQGTCDGATRVKRMRAFEKLSSEVDLVGERRQTAIRFGMTPQVTEFTFACTNKRTPSLTIYIAGNRAMTCFSGVCYLLTSS